MKTVDTIYHPVGSCKMGKDPLAVVDDRLKVHGVSGLRVADASIMPTLVSGNTNAPSIMIGERCADFIKNDHQIQEFHVYVTVFKYKNRYYINLSVQISISSYDS